MTERLTDGIADAQLETAAEVLETIRSRAEASLASMLTRTESDQAD